MRLRPYQQAAHDHFLRAYRSGGARQVIHLPTGTGKTTIGLSIAKSCGRALWLAHRDELIRQPAKAARNVWPDASVGIVKAGEDESDARDLVIASIQTVTRPERLARIASQPWALVVIDEVHHSLAQSWSRVIEALDHVPRLGLTATPERHDGKGLDALFDSIQSPLPLPRAIEEGWLVPFRQVRVGADLSLASVARRNGDYAQGDLARALDHAGVAGITAQAVHEHCHGQKTIVFAAGVDLSRKTVEALRLTGTHAAHIDGNTPTDERRAILEAFGRGDIQVVSNVDILTEGYDQPDVSAIVMARPTRSKPLYVQMAGRGLRPAPGKRELLLIDLVDNQEEHDLATAPILLGREQREKGDREAQERATQPTAEEMDHWLKRIQSAASRCREEFAWVSVGRAHALSAGQHGTVLVIPTEDGYRAELVNGGIHVASLAIEGSTLEWAVGVGEDLVRRVASTLSGMKAEWRKRKASEKQLAALKRAGIEAPVNCRRGQASDLLDQHFANLALKRFLKQRPHPVTWYAYDDPGTGRHAYAVCQDARTAGRVQAQHPGYPVLTVEEHGRIVGLDGRELTAALLALPVAHMERT